MIGLLGPRGIGKTTMALQFIRENLPRKHTLYVSADDLYFSTHTLLSLANEFAQTGGKYLFIDEIHKYQGWSRELKLIYDYHSELKIFFTGSSVLDIYKGVADLSRRALIYQMQGLSYREYLSLFHGIEIPAYSLEQILNHEVVLPPGFLPLEFFSDYLRTGYYPFSGDNYEQYLSQVINATIEVDIPQYANLSVSTTRKLKRLLAILSESAPFKPNFSQIGSRLEVSRNSVADLCTWLEKAGLICLLRDSAGGIQGLGKVEKIYLDNTNLMAALSPEHSDTGTMRETFFLNQMRVNYHITSSPQSDFLVGGKYTIEVGGKGKGGKQFRGLDNAFIAKDNVETGYGDIVPLWQFGLTY